jgi:hypothetical protein
MLGGVFSHHGLDSPPLQNLAYAKYCGPMNPSPMKVPAAHETMILLTSLKLNCADRVRGRYVATSYKKMEPLSRPLLRISVAAAKNKPETSIRISCWIEDF